MAGTSTLAGGGRDATVSITELSAKGRASAREAQTVADVDYGMSLSPAVRNLLAIR